MKASEALFLLNGKADGRGLDARASSSSPVLGVSPVPAGSGGAGEMLGLQLPGEGVTSVP